MYYLKTSGELSSFQLVWHYYPLVDISITAVREEKNNYYYGYVIIIIIYYYYFYFIIITNYSVF